MADPARRLTIADQALIHTAAAIALDGVIDFDRAFWRRELAEILPRVNRGIPALERLAAECDRLVADDGGAAEGFIRTAIAREVQTYHKFKAAGALDRLRAETEGQDQEQEGATA